MPHPIVKAFFQRDVKKIASDLIGCYLVKKTATGEKRLMITETEAYDGSDDLACHASKGMTERNKVMFGEAGRIYVYFVYGMYWMLNIVTGKIGYPAAVLIRGVEGAKGPGKLTRELGIDKSFYGKKLSKETGIWIEKRDRGFNERSIKKTARIGVDYAGPIWSKKKYRFCLN